MRISKGRILAASIAVAAIAAMMPISVLPSSGGTHFQTATGATSTTVTVTVSLAPTSVTISGITDVEGTTLTYGIRDSTATAGALGTYSFAVPYNWSGVVTPTMTGYTFIPDHLDFANVQSHMVGNDFTSSLIVAVEQDADHTIPKEYMLAQNYPNPFNPSTVIRFAVARAGFASLKVYNIVGQEVVNLVEGNLPAGIFRAIWNGTDASGETVASGVYFYRLQAGDFVDIRKMLLLK
jgi:hypothetical protein